MILQITQVKIQYALAADSTSKPEHLTDQKKDRKAKTIILIKTATVFVITVIKQRQTAVMQTAVGAGAQTNN